MEDRIKRAWTSLIVGHSDRRFSEELLQGLPDPVARYLMHAIRPGAQLAESARFEMQGSIKPGNLPWMRFSASQVLNPRGGFVWKVRARLGPLVISGADLLFQSEGRTVMKLFGLIGLIDASGPDVSKSAIGRLAGESVLVPSSLLPQQDVHWEAEDAERATVSVTANGESSEVNLAIDSKGRLQQVWLPRWGNQTSTGDYEYIPFGVRFGDEQEFGGYTIPTRLRAGWWYGTDRYAEFFRADIRSAVFT